MSNKRSNSQWNESPRKAKSPLSEEERESRIRDERTTSISQHQSEEDAVFAIGMSLANRTIDQLILVGLGHGWTGKLTATPNHFLGMGFTSQKRKELAEKVQAGAGHFLSLAITAVQPRERPALRAGLDKVTFIGIQSGEMSRMREGVEVVRKHLKSVGPVTMNEVSVFTDLYLRKIWNADSSDKC
jgi:hypothetical protein